MSGQENTLKDIANMFLWKDYRNINVSAFFFSVKVIVKYKKMIRLADRPVVA